MKLLKLLKLFKLFKLLRLFPFITKSYAFVTNANFIILKEQQIFSEILDVCNIPCHIRCARVKTFQSTIEKLNRINNPNTELDSNSKNTKNIKNKINVPNIDNIYNLHDLIGFRYVFYTKEDLLKFYHQIRLEKKVMYSKNYINEPKENGYSALHLRYKNEYAECPVKQLECQLYIIEDYYNSMYSHAMYFKNYTKLC